MCEVISPGALRAVGDWVGNASACDLIAPGAFHANLNAGSVLAVFSLGKPAAGTLRYTLIGGAVSVGVQVS